LAVQGGLLASSVAQQREEHKEDSRASNLVPVLSFLVARLLAYTLVGLVLGLVGEVAQPSLGMRVALQLAVSLFMVGTALNLLQVHPLFKYFVIQPPRFLTRLVKNQSRSKSIFGPALLGAFTIFIPCGATQAMMAYAVTTGSPVSGALTMFVFILGTSPLFFLLGYAAKGLGDRSKFSFDKIAAWAIILIALYNINGALTLSGWKEGQTKILGTSANTVSQATIYFTRSGYRSDPSVINVRGGSTIKLTLVNEDGAGCIQAFTIPKFGIQKIVPPGKTDTVTLTTPNASGVISFMCSMGMFRGVINVN